MRYIRLCIARPTNRPKAPPENHRFTMSVASRPDDKTNDIPEVLVDTKNKRTYNRLRFFGKVRVAESQHRLSAVLGRISLLSVWFVFVFLYIEGRCRVQFTKMSEPYN